MMQKLSKQKKLESLVGKEVLVVESREGETKILSGILHRVDIVGLPRGYYVKNNDTYFQIPMKAISDFSRRSFNNRTTPAAPRIIVDYKSYESLNKMTERQNGS